MLRRKSLKASNNTEQTVSKQDRKRKRREAPQGVTLEQAVLGKSVNLLVEGRSEEHSVRFFVFSCNECLYQLSRR
eukprot:m.198873 g.198873  ORF g.198873 m.198873 type:complete len:75 (+) comp15721_c0_seq5:160-384(+)